MTVARAYTAAVNISTAFTTAIDVLEILAASAKPCVLLGFELGQTTEVGDAQEEVLTLVLKRVTGSPTSGSGGGTSTFQPTQPNAAAAGVTLETGNTTALSGGTSVELARFPWNVRTPLLYVPVPEEQIVFDAGTRLVLSLAAAPGDSIGGIVGRVQVGELI